MTNNNITTLLEIEGVNAKGFGTIPKILMQDQRLSIESKAIYSYFCSYAGNGTQAFPKVEKIIYDLQISKDRYYKHLKPLKKYGYIKTKQIKSNGKFFKNIYTLVINPIEIIEDDKANDKKPKKVDNTTKTPPCPQNNDTGKIEELPCPENSYSENAYTQDLDTNINSLDINSSNINNLSIYLEEEQKENDRLIDRTEIEQKFKNQIDYNILIENNKFDIFLIDNITNIAIDVICSSAKHQKINKSNIPQKDVVSQFHKLREQHIEHIIFKIKELSANGEEIKNIRGYIISCLYNTATTLDIFNEFEI